MRERQKKGKLEGRVQIPTHRKRTTESPEQMIFSLSMTNKTIINKHTLYVLKLKSN